MFNQQGGLPLSWGDPSTALPLVEFSCASCNLSGPLPEWGHPTSCPFGYMQHFDVSDNALTGSVPNIMSAWGSLRTFDVSRNMLSGTVFGSGSCNLDSLTVLRVSHNQLSGQLFSSGTGQVQTAVFL
jgi:hypothetical protein